MNMLIRKKIFCLFFIQVFLNTSNNLLLGMEMNNLDLQEGNKFLIGCADLCNKITWFSEDTQQCVAYNLGQLQEHDKSMPYKEHDFEELHIYFYSHAKYIEKYNWYITIQQHHGKDQCADGAVDLEKKIIMLTNKLVINAMCEFEALNCGSDMSSDKEKLPSSIFNEMYTRIINDNEHVSKQLYEHANGRLNYNFFWAWPMVGKYCKPTTKMQNNLTDMRRLLSDQSIDNESKIIALILDINQELTNQLFKK